MSEARSQDDPAVTHRVASIIGPVLVASAFSFMLWRTWRGWNDPQIDFGQTLFVAWLLSEGAVLYRDIAYMFGPLSASINGWLFMIVGPGLMHLAAFNMMIAALVVVELHVLLQAIAGRASAIVGCLVFVLMFGFAQYTRLGNYNFITPYTPEMTHGLALSLLMLCLLHWHASRPRQMFVVLAGVCWGAVFLTKPEIFFAASCALAVYALLNLRRSDSSGMRLEALGQFAIGALVLPVGFLIMFRTSMSWSDALRAVAGAWTHVFNTQLTGLPFYQRSMGIDDASGNAMVMLKWTLCLAAIALVPMVVAMRVRPSDARSRRAGVIAGFMFCLLIFIPLTILWRPQWFESARALTITTLAALVTAAFVVIRRNSLKPLDESIALRAAFIVFAAALLAKVVLHARLYQYGFVMALPAMMVLVGALMDWIPSWVVRRGGSGMVVQLAAIGLFGAVAMQAVRVTGQLHNLKRVPMGVGADSFVADQRGQILNDAAEWIASALPPDRLLVVLPEGVMLNYLARRSSSIPFVSVLPSDVAAFGEQRILDSLRAHPPELIAILHRDSSELGARFFGRDYAQDIMTWVTEQYQPVVSFGSPPLVDEGFGVQIMSRRPDS